MIDRVTPVTAAYIAARLSADEICVRDMGRDEAERLAYYVATTSPLSVVAFSPSYEPVSMFGAFPDETGTFAHAWMFCTPNARKAAVTIFKASKAATMRARELWGPLLVDPEVRSTKQAKFLEAVGFAPRSVIIRRDGEIAVELQA